MTFGILIPWPPSLNHYWRHCRGRHFISPEGITFRQEIQRLIAAQNPPKLTGRISISISASPPDRRIRDLDNLLKVPLDALQMRDSTTTMAKSTLSASPAPVQGARAPCISLSQK